MTAADKQLITISEQSTSLASPKDMVNFASTLKQFIVEQGLYTNIQGKNYVHVEAWQFCGATMGVMPIVKLTERIVTDDPGEMKYRVEVELHRLENDQVIGSGVALCSNRENKKRNFDEYAVASMAQTRAIGKAYRNAFGWLMKVAGYEATPHEEMDGVGEKDDFTTASQRVLDKTRKIEHDIIDNTPSRNTVAENAKYMNTKASDTAKEFPDLEREYAEPEPQDNALARAKIALHEMLEAKGYNNAVKMKAFITKALGKSTIDSLDDADKIAYLLEGAE